MTPISSSANQVDDLTLFALIAAMLVYRTIDIFASHQKLIQLTSRVNREVPWDRNQVQRRMRTLLMSFGENARHFAVRYEAMVRIERNYVYLTMYVYLGLLAVVGFSMIASQQGILRIQPSFLTAMATALVSSLPSAINWGIENVRAIWESKRV